MFSRAKRFDDRPVGCGADAVYNPQDGTKPTGGVIPKVDRFGEFKQSHSLNSDTESVHSEKSQVFRTPKAIRRNILTGSIKRTETKNGSLKINEFLEAKDVEIRNKDETIHEYELQIKDLADKIYLLETELKSNAVNSFNIENEIYECKKCKNYNDEIIFKTKYENLLSVNEKSEADLKSYNNLRTHCEVLNEERSEIDTLLTELNASSENSEFTLIEKIIFLKESLETNIAKISELKTALSQSEIEIETLYITVSVKDEELRKIASLNKYISELEEKIERLDTVDEKRSLDVLAMSDLINANKFLCAELNEKLDKKDDQIKELMEDLALVKGQHALALEANESIRHEYKMEIDTLRAKHGDELLHLEKRHADMIEEKCSKCTESIVEMREKHYLNMKNLEDKFMNQIIHLEEVASENIRISEIQFEERYIELQIYSDKMLDNEKQNRLNELQMCQEMTEKEINNSIRQINEFQKELQIKNNDLMNLKEHIREYQTVNNAKEEQLANLQSKFDAESENYAAKINGMQSDMDELKAEIDKLNREKNMFSVTLESMRQTVEALGSRLCKSDEDVMLFKKQLEDSKNLNALLKEEIVDIHIEFSHSKEEYEQLLTSIVKSKSILDKCNDDLMRGSSELLESIEELKMDKIKDVNDFKTEKNSFIDEFTAQCLALVEKAESKADSTRDMYLRLKTECDEAYTKIEECQNLLLTAESNLESKDQELNELEQENNRISGTLAASEQEKSELQTLLNAFDKLAKDTTVKIHNYLECIHKKNEEIYALEDRVKKLTEFLEATEFIVKEKDLTLNKYENDISALTSENKILAEDVSELDKVKSELESHADKCKLDYEKSEERAKTYEATINQMQSEIYEKKSQIESLQEKMENFKSHLTDCKEELLQIQCDNLQKELDEMTEKYANLLGHQNNKQKIKHVIDLKTQNSTLKEENEKLSFTIQKQTTLIEKLKKDIGDAHIKSPLMQKKQYLFGGTPHGKENRVKPLSPSPSRLGSPKAERSITPLKDCNR